MHQSGWVFDIQRYSIHDGPGIRTTVFLQGCPLRCRWCHNPEGLRAGGQVRFHAARCIGCGRCVAVCAPHGHQLTAEGQHTLDRSRCTRCGQCAQACLTGALELAGKQMTVDEVMAVVVRDAPYYQQSGGGMTLSGGEPLAQRPFSRALLTAARAAGYHTAIETSAYLPWKALTAFLPLVDLFLVDIKAIDPQRHRALTGVNNARILENIRQLAAAGAALHLRVPVVPGENETEEFFAALAAFVTSLPDAPLLELLPYHQLGTGKWQSLGLEPHLPDTPPLPPETLASWRGYLQAQGVNVVGVGD